MSMPGWATSFPGFLALWGLALLAEAAKPCSSGYSVPGLMRHPWRASSSSIPRPKMGAFTAW